jgi:hypothetical protein
MMIKKLYLLHSQLNTNLVKGVPLYVMLALRGWGSIAPTHFSPRHQSNQRHTPALLYPQERTPGTHWTGGWVGRRASPDTEARGKICLCHCRGSNPGRPVHSSLVLLNHGLMFWDILFSRHFPGRTEGKLRKSWQDTRCLGRDFNPGPPEYEAGIVTTRPRRSVSKVQKNKITVKRKIRMRKIHEGRKEEHNRTKSF